MKLTRKKLMEMAGLPLQEKSSNVTAVYADYKDADELMDGIINAINSLGIGFAKEDESTSESDTIGIIIGRNRGEVEQYQKEILGIE